jgi:hypothetical protein
MDCVWWRKVTAPCCGQLIISCALELHAFAALYLGHISSCESCCRRVTYKIWGSSGDYEEFCHLGYYVVQSVESELMFWRNMSSPSCFVLVSCWAYSSTLKVVAKCSSEILVDFHQATWRYIPKDGTIKDWDMFDMFRASHFFQLSALLERVFLRIGSAESDEQLQRAVSKFLPPVILKLSSQQDGVRKKVHKFCKKWSSCNTLQ